MSRKKALPISVTASISADRKPKQSFAPLLIKLALTLCGCLGSVFSFLTCVKLPVSGLLTAAEITLFCAVFTLIFSFKKGYFGIASSVSAAGFTLAVYLFRNEICAGLANVLNIYLASGRKKYYDEPFITILRPEMSEKHIRIFVFFAAAFICIFTAYFTVRFALSAAVVPITGLPAFAALFFGFEPSFAAFFALVACWTGIIAMETSDSDKIDSIRRRNASALCGLTAAVTAALCLSAIYGAAELFDYKRPERLDLLYDKAMDYNANGGVQNTIDNIVSNVISMNRSSGAINHGKLGENGEISFSGNTVLEVNMPKTEGTVYLRGFVGSVYTGSSWEDFSGSKKKELEEITAGFNTAGLDPLMFDSYNLKYTRNDFARHSFSVKNIDAESGYLYMPYNLVPESVARYIPQGGSSFSGSDSFYMGQFYNPTSYYGYQSLFRVKWLIPAQLKEDEALYRRFVYDNYLELPEEHTKIAEVLGDEYLSYITSEDIQTGKSTLNEMTVFSRKLNYIKKWLRNNCEYSLNAGKLPANTDFVDYFLTNRKGSCSHFATAAVMMCRYAGIPARYVEGYVVKPKDFPADIPVGENAVVEVTDARGHAWAEIYIDGFGWYPLEFTSGYGNIRTALPTETTLTLTSAAEVISETDNAVETTITATGSAATATGSAANENNMPVPAPENQQTAVPNAGESKPAETVPPASEHEVTVTEKPSVGFGAFGIKGGKKVNVFYDLTVPIIIVGILLLVPLVLVLRRRIVIIRYRRLAADYKNGGAIAVYRRFQKLLKLMGMPEQAELSHAEYAAVLAERSPLLAEGAAEDIINAALKASFGGGALTHEEARELTLNVNSLVKRYVNKLSAFERFKAKYVYCIA
ncbi:MAG: transglutaminase domain-containing protein [Oscillospiraceae bacterium]|nr:transglutaminase domain-containing protein [Oscillospiraceae bacterium]